MMDSGDLHELWRRHVAHQPDAVVMPCACGRMPAPLTIIAAQKNRRCVACYLTELRLAQQLWSRLD